MIKVIDLKPCPLCGGKAVVLAHTFPCMNDAHSIQCTVCGTQSLLWFGSLNELVKRWNRRVKDDRQEQGD